MRLIETEMLEAIKHGRQLVRRIIRGLMRIRWRVSSTLRFSCTIIR
jgi:hypothetical protein